MDADLSRELRNIGTPNYKQSLIVGCFIYETVKDKQQTLPLQILNTREKA